MRRAAMDEEGRDELDSIYKRLSRWSKRPAAVLTRPQACWLAVLGSVAVAVCGLSIWTSTTLASAGQSIASAPALLLGAPQSGGGQGEDFWRVQLVGGDVLNINASSSSGKVFDFFLYPPTTNDGDLSHTSALGEVETTSGITAAQQVSLQAPYSGNFVLAVNEGGKFSCCANPMDPYLFTPTLQGGGVSLTVGAAETQASGSIASAPDLRIGAFEAGGGQAEDFWKVSLASGEELEVDATSPGGNVFDFFLYPPSTIDGTLGQTKPAAEALTTSGVTSAQEVRLRAPHAGLYIFAVNEGGKFSCCSNPMTPYTFTTAGKPSAASLRARKLAAALRACSKVRSKRKRIACIRTARKRY
jgi:hypothetical protein